MLNRTHHLYLAAIGATLIVIMLLITLSSPAPKEDRLIPTLMLLPSQGANLPVQIVAVPTGQISSPPMVTRSINAEGTPTFASGQIPIQPKLLMATTANPTEESIFFPPVTTRVAELALPTALPFPTLPPAQAPTYTYVPQLLPPPQATVPNQVMIAFKPDTGQQERDAYVSSLGGEVKQSIDALNIVVVEVSDAFVEVTPFASNIVAASEPDYYVSAQVALPPSDPYYDQQWTLPVIGAPEAWLALPEDAPTVTVAVIDSGVCADSPDLQGRVMPGWDFVEADADPQDVFGHGCGVAGIIAANADNGIGMAGIAPNAQILPLRVLDGSGIGTYSDVAAAIVYATDNGAQVINLSLGGANASSVLEQAVDYAVNKGVTVVAAAGNTGSEQLLYPAAYEPVIAVGAVDQNLQVSSFSARGAGIDLFAPGREVLTLKPDGSFGMVSGTSFAAPQVSGVAALETTYGRSLALGGLVAVGGGLPVETLVPTTESATPIRTANSISIDFDSVVSVPEEFRGPIATTMLAQSSLVPDDAKFYATAFRISNDGNWARIVLVPSYVIDSGWENFRFEDMVQMLAYRGIGTTAWQTSLYAQSDFQALANQVPSDFIDFASLAAPAAAYEYLFPWTSGYTFWKNGGQHGDGYSQLPDNRAIDFQAWTRTNTGAAVLASAPGLLDTVCGPDSKDQTWLMISNNDGTMGYGHIQGNTVPTDLIGHPIVRGQYIGVAYSIGANYGDYGGCGYGAAAHIHIVFPRTDICMYSTADSENRWVCYSEMAQDDGIGVIYYKSTNARVDGSAAIPGKPTITSPTQNQVLTSRTFNIVLQPGTLNYTGQYDFRIQIASNPDFATDHIVQTIGWENTKGKTSFSVSMPSDGTYYVRVTQGDTINSESGWTSTRTFQVSTAPNAPTITSPTNNQIITDYQVGGDTGVVGQITTQLSGNAGGGYRLELANGLSQSFVNVPSGWYTTSNIDVPLPTSVDGWYRLRAQTCTSGGVVSGYSSIIQFKLAPPTPTIATQPQNEVINSGQTTTLTVTASGVTPLTYQWYRGTSGDTSNPVGTNAASFTTPALTETTSYWVRVSNAYAQVNSSTATVTMNTAPTLSDIADQTTNYNTATSAIAFTVSDTETAAGSLTVTGTSPNTTLVPNGNIVLGGSGANRTVRITPASGKSGTATITITVSDGGLSASDTFLLTVRRQCFGSSVVNDCFETATVVTSLPFSADQSVTNATAESLDPDQTCIGYPTSRSFTRSVWFRYTPTVNGRVKFEVDADDPNRFDSIMSAYTGTLGSLTQVACSDDITGDAYNFRSIFELNVTSGTSYYVMVTQWADNGDVGNQTNTPFLKLRATQVTIAPTITTPPHSKTINSGETTTLSVVASGTAPLTYQWYRGSSGDTSNPVGTNAASLTTPALTTATSYWVRVTNALGHADSSTATVSIMVTPPPNDLFANAQSIGSLPYTYTQDINGSTLSASDPPMRCLGAEANNYVNSVWFEYQADTDGPVLLNTIGSDYNTALAVYTGSESDLTPITCDDSSTFDEASIVGFNATAGTTYRVLIAKGGTTAATSVTRLQLNAAQQNLVEVVDVFTTDDEGLAAPSTSAQIADSIKAQAAITSFDPGDPIRLYMSVLHSFAGNINALFEWQVTDVHGVIVPELSYTCNCESGSQDLFIARSIPQSLPQGTYTFRGSATYGNQVSSNTMTFAVNPSAAMVDIAIAPPSSTVSVSDSFDVAVEIQGGSHAVDAAAAYLDFDPAVLTVTSLSPGASLPIVLQNSFNNTVGTVDFAAGLLSGTKPTGTFTLVTIHFQALAAVENTTLAFHLAGTRQTDVTDSGVSIFGAAQGGTVTITETTLVASVMLEGRPAAPSALLAVPLQVVIYPTGSSTAVFDAAVTSNEQGEFLVSGLYPGSYDVYVKYARALRLRTTFMLDAGVNTIALGELQAGDADNNNLVNLVDFSMLAATFGKAEGATGYDARTDFNGDGIISLLDFSLLASNFGQTGT